MIEKEPFRSYQLDAEKKEEEFVVSIKFNKEEMNQLKELQELFEQAKPSTCLKQCMKLVILDKKMLGFIGMVADNRRRNKRLGIAQFDL